MKKTAYLIMIVVVMSLATRFVFAEEMKGSMKEGEMEGKGMMMGKGMMGKGGMMGMMHGMMRSSSMVASNDGGVIVLTGNKLYKYDKNLNLIKEAEIKTEMGGMGMGGMKMCPMCAKMMGNGMMGNDDAKEDDPAQKDEQPASQPSEHESHH